MKFKSFLRNFNKSAVVAFYVANKGEISVKTLLNHTHSLGAKYCLPKIQGSEIIFVETNPESHLIKGKFNIYEPEIGLEVVPSVIIVPNISCDEYGNRLGYGGGYYDKYLSRNKEIYKIALCYQNLISANELPNTSLDIKRI